MPGARLRTLLRARVAVLSLISVLFAIAAFGGESFAAPPPAAIQVLLSTSGRATHEDAQSLKAFYARRNYAPAWSGSAAADSDRKILLAAFLHADADGLVPSDYWVGDAGDDASHDIELTIAAFHYARDLHGGRAEFRSIDADVELPADRFDAVSALSSALETRSLSVFLASLAPREDGYALLKSALAHFRSISAAGGWPSLPQANAKRFASDDALAALLRRRLAYEDASIGAASDLAASVAQFQAHNGLNQNGKVDKPTLLALNISAEDRVSEISANMERWRWLPHDLENRYVSVNVADTTLSVVENGRIVLTSKVIAGRPHDRTPILRAVAFGVTVNPPWNVPAPIARKEILPKLKRNRNYLESQDMILVDGPRADPHGLGIDWHAIPKGSFPYRVQQLPGEKNALGTVKLELPNRFDVYLHDTPAKSLFGHNERHLSHGCVRVEQIVPLASYALTGDPASLSLVTGAVAAGTTEYIPLSKPLPIYFLYWTAFVDGDGTVEFRPDVYGRDQRLIAAMARRGRGSQMTSNETGNGIGDAVGCHGV